MTTVIIQGRMFVEPLLCPGCPALCCYFPWVLFDSCPGGSAGKEPTCHCRRHKRHGFDPWVGKIPWMRSWQPTPVFLPGKFHQQRSLVSYSPESCRVRHHWIRIRMGITVFILPWDPAKRSDLSQITQQKTGRSRARNQMLCFFLLKPQGWSKGDVCYTFHILTHTLCRQS